MADANAAPLTHYLEANAAAVAAGSDANTVVAVVPEDGTVSAVSYTTISAVSGADTNTRTISIINKGGAGTGTTSVASLALASGTNTAAFGETALALSGASGSPLNVTAGDVLVFNSAHGGSGLADPGGRVRITLVRR